MNQSTLHGHLEQIGSRHLVYDPDKAAYPSISRKRRKIRVDEQPMLDDLLSSGIYGDSNMSRKNSSNITLDAVATQKQGRKKKSVMLSSVFPSVSSLSGRYPYLKNHP